MEEEDDLGIGLAGFDIMPADQVVVASGVDKMVSEGYAVDDLGVTLLIFLPRDYRGKVCCSFINRFLRRNESFKNIGRSFGQRGVIWCLHDDGAVTADGSAMDWAFSVIQAWILTAASQLGMGNSSTYGQSCVQ